MIDRFVDFLKGKRKEKDDKVPQFDNNELREEAESLLSYILDPVSVRTKSGKTISVRLIKLTNYEVYRDNIYHIVLVAERDEVDIRRFKEDIISYIEYVDAKYGVDFSIKESNIMCDWISKDNPDNFKRIPLKDIYEYKGKFQAIAIGIKKYKE